MQVLKSILVMCLVLSPISSFADEADIKSTLLKAIPSLDITEVKKSEIDGLYSVIANGQTLFSNKDGSFFITGELYSAVGGKLINLSEVKREQTRADQLAGIKPSDKIVFPAKGETKARIAVFTDIDCGYCRKLHKEVPKMNEMGIEVSYLAYPRAGIGSESYNKIVSAYCAKDQLKALTDAKQGKTIDSITCENPVAAQLQLGQEMGVTGTPAIVLETGQLVPGYMPADRLGKLLGVL